MSELAVHTEHITYLTCTYAYITGWNVSVRTYVAPQLKKISLAETHNLIVRFATW